MNNPMDLEEYKRAVINSLRSKYGLSSQEEQNLLQTSNALWEQFYKDFSPEVCAQGIQSGLI